MEEGKTEIEEITIEEKLEQSEDKFLRLAAEFENYKKRVKKEKEDLVLSTKTKVLSSVLDMDSEINLAINSMKVEDEGLLLIAQK